MNIEQIYRAVAHRVASVYQAGKRISCKELLEWINSTCNPIRPYGGIRGVPKAAHSRGNDFEKEALEYALIDSRGKNPCK